eukprot:CAMPEP_0198235380 /NCGR_PEP_ID=MMETSP1446-20131203/1281_1 /TAXON_ID=1461542 ORGANISM="Unidentified sp, Strain CCMP2111" /NCGR_SAMPLE_ID=MMETSP1446 /ASSEMBLY_ACC=CAM_ASM_001112 /LENGTH=137 /DNA_ID=CAMNT_0043916521 /DNA_START=1054 /DNA_END=1467 /DNA_ORIENTATION=-
MGRVEHNRLVLCSKEEPYSELTAGTIVELAHTRDSLKEWRAPLHGDRADSWLMAVLHHDAFGAPEEGPVFGDAIVCESHGAVVNDVKVAFLRTVLAHIASVDVFGVSEWVQLELEQIAQILNRFIQCSNGEFRAIGA